MPSQEIINQKNSAANAEQVSESNLELVPQPKQEHDTSASPQGLPHAFVVMPFGKKKGPDERWIDFNSIYQDLIKPALIEAGFEPFRADEESVSGDILTDMFQELLLADLVIADISIDNANVFYELGVRHALRKRGLIHIQSGRGRMPFDIFNVRTLPYHCDENGQPDRQYLEKDKQAIAKMARATWESDPNRIHSPIFNLLDGLEEPDRRSLQTPLAIGYWDEYNNWRKRVVIAQRQDRIGDVLLLIEEVSNPLIKCEAIAEAGKALRNLGNYQLALQQYRNGLTLQPKNAEFRREEAFHLSRLKRYDEAVVQLESLLRDEPANIDAISYLARIYKEMWKERWVGICNEAERLQTADESAHLLQKAIETYLQAYRLDQNHYYSGINALTLSAVFKYLARHGRDGDPEEKAIKEELPVLSGAVKFSLDSAALKDNNDVWVFLSLGDLAICTASNPQQVARAYKRALNRLWNNKFALLSTLEQLKLLESLNFRLEYVKSGLDVLEAELKRIENQEAAIASQTVKEPPQVFLFSGHMIDKPDRPRLRFPPAMETEAQQKIKEVLDNLKADARDLAIAPGIACGGDILFLEACLERQMKVEVYLPFESAQFIEKSVSFAGDDWVERFYEIKNHPQVELNLQPERIGAVPKGSNSFERNNRWALYSSLIYGIERMRLIVLWDGKGGDGRGGTGDMVKQVRQLGGIVEHLDTTKFDYWKAQGAGIGNREA
jgi:tetratricopeptide (TPR) repeat protein